MRFEIMLGEGGGGQFFYELIQADVALASELTQALTLVIGHTDG
jgi:hypothetical protein